MSSLTSCPFCERLYTHHSLNIHRPKCRSNPSVNSMPRSSSVKVSKKKSVKDRPRTRSICRHEKVEFRVCLVCADKVELHAISAHEQLCLEKWNKICKKISKRFEVRKPVPLLVPSLDGSLDIQRLNEHAIQQSRKSQFARCRRCQLNVSIVAAIDHKCTRFEPAVEFFF
ncbi:unnamed protein product [Auanema sp. JU1783]|nr:unnamed protein product [Auanema sp. JU1783]